MNRRHQLGRLKALEDASNSQRVYFRTPAGRRFSIDIGDVVSIAMDCLGWLHEQTSDPPRGPVLKALATAVPDKELGLLAQTAVMAAQRIEQGAQR
ncbi:hypothetical protein [Streptomyces hydrogenans]